MQERILPFCHRSTCNDNGYDAIRGRVVRVSDDSFQLQLLLVARLTERMNGAMSAGAGAGADASDDTPYGKNE